MIIKNDFGIVDFDWKDYENICLSFSGGADSTLMLWLALNSLQHKPNTTLHTFTGVTPAKGKFKQFTSQEIFDDMVSHFPQHNDRIEDRIIMYNDTQEDLGDRQIEMHMEDKFDLRMYAVTANPPHDVMEKHNLLHRRIEKRDLEVPKNEWNYRPEHRMMYQPFINVDKRWVSQAFKDFGLMRYYNNTISCERFRDTPDMQHNEEPCGHCWWCREKKMAFGMLDGQHEQT